MRRFASEKLPFVKAYAECDEKWIADKDFSKYPIEWQAKVSVFVDFRGGKIRAPKKKFFFSIKFFASSRSLCFFLLRSRQFNLLSLWIKCCLLLSRVVSYVLNIFTFFPLRFLDPQRSAQKPEWGGMRNASLLVFSLFFLLKSSNNDNKWYSYMEKAFLWRSWARSFDDSMGGRRNEMRFEGLFLILVINTRRHFLFLFFFNFAMAFLAFLFTIV